MGSDPNERAGRKPRKSAGKGTEPDFWSWHPTEAQKRHFETWLAEQSGLEELLDGVGRQGIVLTLTRAKTSDSACVVARSRFDSYGEGQALATFHVSAERALYGMLFVLSVLHPSWPAEPVRVVQQQINW